jgi:hypothetical protein
VYFPNPIPLSSKSLLAMAMLFDRVHFPGVSIVAGGQIDADERDLKLPPIGDPEQLAYHNLRSWAARQPSLREFIHLPDQRPDGTLDSSCNATALENDALTLVDDTYAAGISSRVVGVTGAQVFSPVGGSSICMSLVWPLYQVRAVRYAEEAGLPLLSDDPLAMPPLPAHPDAETLTRRLAQQLAMEAVSLVLPRFKSVTLSQVIEFRGELEPLVRPFRQEMIAMAADLGAAILGGATDKDLKALAGVLAYSRIAPKLRALSKEMAQPLKPFHKMAIDVTEFAVAAASSSLSPALSIGWVCIRGAKIVSDYVRLYTDREGKRKSGLAYLLRLQGPDAGKESAPNDWDRRDWRCSGYVDIPEPGHPLTPRNRQLVAALPGVTKIHTIRRVFQQRTMSFVTIGPREGARASDPGLQP